MIERNIYVYKKTNVPPVYVVYGSDSVSIKINLLDYDVPSGATATAYASLRRGSTVYTNSATISGNSITVSPAVGFFVPGENNLQIDVTYNSKKLVTFALDVNCEGQLSNNGSATAPSIRTVAQVDADLTTLSGTVSTKVAQEAGKGLSSNDYTDSAKAKVDAIPSNPKYTDTIYDDTQIKSDIKAITGVSDCTDFKSGYIDLSGSITNVDVDEEPTEDSRFVCAIIECDAGDIFHLTSTADSGAKNYAFLKENGDIINRKTGEYVCDDDLLIAPTGSAYLAINAYKSSAHHLRIGKYTKDAIEEIVNKKDIPLKIAYPFDGDYDYYENKWCSGNGIVSAADNLDCVKAKSFPNAKYYTNSVNSINFCCFDSAGMFLGVATYTSVNINGNTNGRIYTTLDNTEYIYLNISHSKTHGDCLSNVFYMITKPEKILTIGDSITWLDGQTGYDNATLFLGWQKVLSENGYEVHNAGYSGYPFAIVDSRTAGTSIYEKIVTNEYDVSGYDIIILFGGTNDDLLAVTVGNEPNVYGQTSFDTSTMAGALSGIIHYIRSNNPTCKIVLSSQIKSESASRPYAEAKQYRDAIKDCALFWDCYFVDNFSLMNCSPGYDGFDTYHYDTTHPNKAGMRRLGKQMLQAVESC